MKNIIIAALILFFAIGCSAQETRSDANEGRPVKGERIGPPSVEEIFKMDANKDGLLSKSEVNGPLQNNFARIDRDGDGFITRKELENAPKPPRGQAPPKK